MNDTQPPYHVRVEITWKLVMRILAGVLLGYLAVRLSTFFKLVVLAILVAVALYPVVSSLQRKGVPRWAGVMAASALLVVLVVGCFAVIGPVVLRQAAHLSDNLPKLRSRSSAICLLPEWSARPWRPA